MDWCLVSKILKRPEPPDLEFETPVCPICLTNTYHDGDGWYCRHCHVWWDNDGQSGRWGEPNEQGCASTVEWFNTDRLSAEHERIRHLRYRCILGEGHSGKHRDFDDWRTWTDDDPRVVVTWEGEPA